MNVIDAIAKRKSVRFFTDREVPVDLIDKIINAATAAPTGGNMQPWQVAVIRGKTKERLGAAYVKAAQEQQPPSPDIPYYPQPMPPKYERRRHIISARIYRAADIRFAPDFVDWPAVIALVTQNYYFFGADTGLLFFIERELEHGSLLDIGMFMQNIMLAAQEYGLATCSQASWGNYPKIAKEILGIGDELRLICGMSLGYPGDESKAPQGRVRESSGEFVRWYS